MFSNTEGPTFARMRAELALAKELQECRRSLGSKHPVCPLPEIDADDPCPAFPELESREAEADRTTEDDSSRSAAATGDCPEIQEQDTDGRRMRRVRRAEAFFLSSAGPYLRWI